LNDAIKIVLKPNIEKGKIKFGDNAEKIIRDGLLKSAVKKGDIIKVPGIALFGSPLPFMIIDSEPDGAIFITESTVIELKNDAIGISDSDKIQKVEPEKISEEPINPKGVLGNFPKLFKKRNK